MGIRGGSGIKGGAGQLRISRKFEKITGNPEGSREERRAARALGVEAPASPVSTRTEPELPTGLTDKLRSPLGLPLTQGQE